VSHTHISQVYAKRDDTPDLRPYRERLLGVRSALSGLDYPHTWAVQRVYESERAAFLVRQYLHANLAQRITTRPFLTLIEKVGATPASSGLDRDQMARRQPGRLCDAHRCHES
jgi:phosphoinositide-3-kinase regulatory subunit 4